MFHRLSLETVTENEPTLGQHMYSRINQVRPRSFSEFEPGQDNEQRNGKLESCKRRRSSAPELITQTTSAITSGALASPKRGKREMPRERIKSENGARRQQDYRGEGQCLIQRLVN